MIATLVHVYVKPEFIKSFIEATRANHENLLKNVATSDLISFKTPRIRASSYCMKPTNQSRPLLPTKKLLTMQCGVTQ